MVFPLSKGGNVLGFWLLISGGGCSLSPEWPKLGDNGGAHGTSPVKPIGGPSKNGFHINYNEFKIVVLEPVYC